MCELHTCVLIFSPQRKSSLFEQTFTQIQYVLQEHGKKGFLQHAPEDGDPVLCVPLVLEVVDRKDSHRIQQRWAFCGRVMHVKEDEESRGF